MPSIAEYFKQKTLLITGSTGFLGQPLVEKILRAQPGVRQIYLLIRPKSKFAGRVSSADDRLEKELFGSSVFDRLRDRHGEGFQHFLSDRVRAVAGDISAENLGLEEATIALLRDELDIVINSAAVVSFDAPLDDALELNIRGAARVARFAQTCRKAHLAHVSTAYVCGAMDSRVPETLYHNEPESAEAFPTRRFRNPQDDIAKIESLIQEVYKAAESQDLERQFKLSLLGRRARKAPGKRREKVDALRRKWIKQQLVEVGMRWARRRGWNDIYTYTKALGEQMVLAELEDCPTVIMRPSVIESSLSEPTPGWLDGLRMADPLIVAIAKGRLRSLPLNPKVALDLVPVDFVVNATLAALVKLKAGDPVRVYQVATADRNPITLGALYALIFRYFRRNPMLDRTGNPIRVKRLKFPSPKQYRLQHRLLRVPLETAEKTLGRLPSFESTQKFKRRISATKVAQQKLFYYGEIYKPYLNLDCRFSVNQLLDLYGWMSEADQSDFNFDVTQLNWRHYIQNVHIPGVKKHILKKEGSGVLELDDAAADFSLEHPTIPALLRQSATRFGQKTALQMQHKGRWSTFSYAELDKEAQAIAFRLLRHGLEKGDRVLLFSENMPEWGLAFLGASYAGLVVVPIDANSWHKEVWSLAEFVEAPALLVSESCLGGLSEAELSQNETTASPRLLFNVNRRCANYDLEPYPRSSGLKQNLPEVKALPKTEPDELASIMFTSGTASNPRGVMHTHRNFLNNLLGVNRFLPVSEQDHLLSVLPLHHSFEFTCGFLMPLFGGATVTYVRSLRPKAILETMRRAGVTCLLGVPTLFALLRDDLHRRILRTSRSPLKSNLVSKSKKLSRSVERTFGRNVGRQLFSKIHNELGGELRLLVSGGSSLSAALYDDFLALGVPIHEGYGLTETAPVLTVNPLGKSRRGSVGKALPGIEVVVSGSDHRGVGELVVRSRSLMKGYFNNPEETGRVLRDNWLHTGDLGWIDEEGYVYVTGRIKDVIVAGSGKNVYPQDLESIYGSIPEIKEMAVAGVRNGLTEETHALVVPAPAANQEDQAATIKKAVASLAKQLPSHQRLQQLHFQQEPLPRGSEGEILRDPVRLLISERRQSGEIRLQTNPSTANADLGDLAQELAALSGRSREQIQPDSDLYSELGLDSLAIVELILLLEHRLGVEIPDSRIAAIRTVRDLEEELASRSERRASHRKGLVRSTLPFSKRPPIDRWLLGLSFRGLRALFKNYFDLSVYNANSLPKDVPFILAANHSSHADTGAVIAAIGLAFGLKGAKRLHILGAQDYFFDTNVKSWFFSTFLNVVPIGRKEASIAGLRTVKSILSTSEPVLIFPEGTRSTTGEVQIFKPGLGLIAWELNVPIVPVRIEGTFQVLPKGRTFPRRNRVQVIFGEPVSMNDYRSFSAQLPRDDLYRKIASDIREIILRLSGHSEEAA